MYSVWGVSTLQESSATLLVPAALILWFWLFLGFRGEAEDSRSLDKAGVDKVSVVGLEQVSDGQAVGWWNLKQNLSTSRVTHV